MFKVEDNCTSVQSDGESRCVYDRFNACFCIINDEFLLTPPVGAAKIMEYRKVLEMCMRTVEHGLILIWQNSWKFHKSN